MSDPGSSSVAVVSLYQKQQKIYARSVSGTFDRWRWALVWITQAWFYGLPWLAWNERQAVLFDLASRRFYLFGLVLYPQDFIYLTGLLVISAVSLFFFTAVAGRLWCGYACPQTVYTEIFMWVERRIQGDRAQHMRRDAGPWSWDRLWRHAGKHAAWLAIGLWTGFSFVGYFTPIRQLGAEVLGLFAAHPAAPLGPWEAFWVLFYGLATYGNAGYLREQVCKYMCPYARFQSAMFDKDTLTVSYDSARGEPRGSRPRQAEPAALGLGSCIDCTLCVQVCPTGIDIRKGLQYECIGCAACIDVCDGIMAKMNYAPGLIRYSTQNALAAGLSRAQILRRTLRPRVLILGAILAAISVGFVASLATRAPFRVDVVRDRASLARIVDDGWVENLYRLQLMNATERPQRYRVAAEGLPGLQLAASPGISLAPAEARWVTLALRMPPQAAQQAGPGAHAMRFGISLIEDDDGRPSSALVLEKSTFVVPR
ncbi:MAG TPA: cytochrome c oxidase accessory protein CcoG [Ideonella sp.]|nr:cytochrome c oxidase accessory protein CcoG [Ideonella sp.]